MYIGAGAQEVGQTKRLGRLEREREICEWDANENGMPRRECLRWGAFCGCGYGVMEGCNGGAATVEVKEWAIEESELRYYNCAVMDGGEVENRDGEPIAADDKLGWMRSDSELRASSDNQRDGLKEGLLRLYLNCAVFVLSILI